MPIQYNLIQYNHTYWQILLSGTISDMFCVPCFTKASKGYERLPFTAFPWRLQDADSLKRQELVVSAFQSAGVKKSKLVENTGTNDETKRTGPEKLMLTRINLRRSPIRIVASRLQHGSTYWDHVLSGIWGIVQPCSPHGWYGSCGIFWAIATAASFTDSGALQTASLGWWVT